MCRQSKDRREPRERERVGDGNLIYEILEALNITDETYKHFTEPCVRRREAAREMSSVTPASATPLTSFANFIDRIFNDRFPSYFLLDSAPI